MTDHLPTRPIVPMSQQISSPVRATFVALAVLALPATASAQRTAITATPQITHPPITAQQPAISAVPLAAIRAFRTGLHASISPVPTSGRSPLVTATLTWPAYPGATGYRVLRQARDDAHTYPFVDVTPSPLAGSTTSVTLQGLPPWGESPRTSAQSATITFHVVALTASGGSDTATVLATLPEYRPDDENAVIPLSKAWPTPPGGLGTVGAHSCLSLAGKLVVAWAPNPAASGYQVKLIQHTPSYIPLPITSVSDTTFQGTLPSAVYLVFVRPTFAVSNWPTAGQTFLVDGQWAWFGATRVGGGIAPFVCNNTYGT